MKCQNCLKRMEPDWKYCPACGIEIVVDRTTVESSPGYKYLPAAFNQYIYRYAAALVEEVQFYQHFVRYVLNLSRSPIDLLHLSGEFARDVQGLVPPRYEGAEEHLLWCTLSICTDRYFSESATAFNLSAEQTAELVDGFYPMIACAFITSAESRRLDLQSYLDWQIRFMAFRDRPAGPKSSCQLCTQKCQFLYDAIQMTADSKTVADFNVCVISTTTTAQDAAAWFVRKLAETIMTGDNLDLAYCMSLQLLEKLEPLPPDKHKLSSEAQSYLAKKVRVSLEETEEAARALKQLGVPGFSSIRQQVFEVIVRQAINGAPWQALCAGPMQVNNISIEEVQAEIKRRTKNN